jgi:glycosyltransferase involved in cell wall biosynthesis
MPKAWFALSREFARAGHRVSIFARRFHGQLDNERIDDVEVIRTLGFPQSNGLAFDLAKDLLYAANLLPRLPPADVLVTNDFWVPVFAGRFGRSKGAVVVCAGRFPKGQYFLYRHVAKVIAISAAVRSAIVEEQPALASRTETIPLPVDLGTRGEGEAAILEREHTLLFVGRVHPEKGIELLLRAWARIRARFPGWRLRIVGPVAETDGGGGSRFEAAIRALAHGLGVEFSKPVFDDAALAAVYRSAELFCYPSLADRGEAFGVAPLEAMAAGVPPIVSALECFADFVRDGENGWVFDHRSQAAEAKLADVLAAAMSDAAARKRRGDRARSDARRFSYSHIAGCYLAAFNEIVAAP